MNTEPVWLPGGHFIFALHEELLADHGGSEGIRDPDVLASALGAPQNLWHYRSPSVFDLAACYAARIMWNHPFVDGNKRTGFMAAYTFLGLNGLRLTALPADATAAALALATKELSQEQFAKWLSDHCERRMLEV